MANTDDLCPQKTDRFVETEVDGDPVLMQIENGYFFTLNETAEAIWNQIDGQLSMNQIIESVAKKFDIPVDICKDHISGFVHELVENELVSFV